MGKTRLIAQKFGLVNDSLIRGGCVGIMMRYWFPQEYFPNWHFARNEL